MTYRCPCCDHDLHTFEQPGLVRVLTLSECHNRTCPLFMVTMDFEQLISLTPAQIANYGATNARMRARELAEVR